MDPGNAILPLLTLSLQATTRSKSKSIYQLVLGIILKYLNIEPLSLPSMAFTGC